MLNVKAAQEELKQKTIVQIHAGTAWTWASRAAAAFKESESLTGINKSLKFSEAQEYLSEAREHASQVNSPLVAEVNAEIGPYVLNAVLSMRDSFEGDVDVI